MVLYAAEAVQLNFECESWQRRHLFFSIGTISWVNFTVEVSVVPEVSVELVSVASVCAEDEVFRWMYSFSQATVKQAYDARMKPEIM